MAIMVNAMPEWQCTWDVDTMLAQCWPTVCDAGPTLNLVLAGVYLLESEWQSVHLIRGHGQRLGDVGVVTRL